MAASILTSLLTLYAIAKVWNRAFWQPVDPDAEHEDDDDWSHGPLHGHDQVSTGTQVMTMWEKVATTQRIPLADGPADRAARGLQRRPHRVAGPLFEITDRAGAELLQRTPYIEAVLGDRGQP